MAHFKLVFLAPRNEQVLEQLKQGLPDVEVLPVDSSLPLEEQAERCRDADAILPFFAGVPLELAKQCPKLRLVQVTSAGTNHLDVRGLGELGVKVANNGGGNAVAVAEQTLALMLMVVRHMIDQWRHVKERKWSTGLNIWEWTELAGKTAGIVGLGRIGQQVARRLKAFDTTLLYYDVITYPSKLEKELGVKRTALDELLRSSDIVTLHVPLSPRTKGLIGARELSLMKPTAILINTCRGPVVEEKALYQALKEKRIAAAGLDVLEQEPTPPDNPILDLDNVVVTPHWAGGTHESIERAIHFSVENFKRVASGQEPLSLVTPE